MLKDAGDVAAIGFKAVTPGTRPASTRSVRRCSEAMGPSRRRTAHNRPTSAPCGCSPNIPPTSARRPRFRDRLAPPRGQPALRSPRGVVDHPGRRRWGASTARATATSPAGWPDSSTGTTSRSSPATSAAARRSAPPAGRSGVQPRDEPAVRGSRTTTGSATSAVIRPPVILRETGLPLDKVLDTLAEPVRALRGERRRPRPPLTSGGLPRPGTPAPRWRWTSSSTRSATTSAPTWSNSAGPVRSLHQRDRRELGPDPDRGLLRPRLVRDQPRPGENWSRQRDPPSAGCRRAPACEVWTVPTNENSSWRASPLTLLPFRQELDRLGADQTHVRGQGDR